MLKLKQINLKIMAKKMSDVLNFVKHQINSDRHIPNNMIPDSNMIPDNTKSFTTDRHNSEISVYFEKGMGMVVIYYENDKKSIREIRYFGTHAIMNGSIKNLHRTGDNPAVYKRLSKKIHWFEVAHYKYGVLHRDCYKPAIYQFIQKGYTDGDYYVQGDKLDELGITVMKRKEIVRNLAKQMMDNERKEKDSSIKDNMEKIKEEVKKRRILKS